MNRWLFSISGAVLAVSFSLGIAPAVAQKAYITNSGSNNVSVIDTATDTVTATIPVGDVPGGVAAAPDGSRVYVVNVGSDSVSVINAITNAVSATIGVGTFPQAVAVTPDGSKAYVTNSGDDTVSVIDAATNTVAATITVGTNPIGVATTPDGSEVYVANTGSSSVSVIDTATDMVAATVALPGSPYDVAVTPVNPVGSWAFVTGTLDDVVWLIDTSTNTVVPPTVPIGADAFGIAFTPSGGQCSTLGPGNPCSQFYVTNYFSNSVFASLAGTIPVGASPLGVAVTPDSSKAYVVNFGSNNVSVIDTATDTVTATISVGDAPGVLGDFIAPAPKFAGTPGYSNCHGMSVSALAKQYRGFAAAAKALGYPSVQALQDAIGAFCQG